MWVNGEWSNDRSGYDRLLDLHRTGWGWEFVRRSPALKDAAHWARRSHRVFHWRGRTGAVFRLGRRCRVAEDFGLHFFPNPDQSALTAPVFWLPEAMSGHLDAALGLTPCWRRRSALRLDRLPGARHYLIAPGRRPKLMISSKRFMAQLAIDNQANSLPHARYLSVSLGGTSFIEQDFSAVEEFAAFCGGGAAEKHLRGLGPERLRNALIALDGELAGVPRREIAGAVFGREMVDTEWHSGDDLYKKRIKRLVEKGLALMNAGYRALL